MNNTASKAVKYLLVIDHYTNSISRSVKILRKQDQVYASLGVILLTSHPDKYRQLMPQDIPSKIVACNFDDQQAIAAAMEPLRSSLCGVICRGDKQVQYLRRVIAYLPDDVLVSSAASLEAATNKRLMREAFLSYAPSITPQMVEVTDGSPAAIDLVESHLHYPVIVKPANLVSSLLIQSCQNRSQLQAALNKVFERISGLYEREERLDRPQVIVEEYLEGDFYSIDAYVLNKGQVYFCPPVAYIPAKQLGIDDFFLYKRFVPTGLSKEQIDSANDVTAKALAAVDLTHSSAHVELVLTKDGWKVIEIGPRLGRFRNTMYRLAYNIDHSLNDVKLHLGIKPSVSNKLQKNCNAYSIYPSFEGRLRAIRGLDRLQNDPRVAGLKVMAAPGDQCLFAKRGGHALAEFVVADSDPAAFAELIEYIEKGVYADID